MKKTFKTIADIVLGLLCAAALAILLAIIIVPLFMGAQRYIIVSDSMAPGIHAGDIVIVKPAADTELRVGAVVTFWQEGQPVTHRITVVDAEKRLIFAKGDANNSEDFEPVPFEKIIGLVKYKVPYLGRITLALKGE